MSRSRLFRAWPAELASRGPTPPGRDDPVLAPALPLLLTNHAPTRQATPITNETAMRTEWWPFAGVVWPKMEGRDPAFTVR